jgi:formiminoglutamase
MDLKIFFSPVDEQVYHPVGGAPAFADSISFFGEVQPDYRSQHIALIGLGGGAGDDHGDFRAAETIRKKLYRLKKGTGAYRIVDLGNLRSGIDRQETQLRLREVCTALMGNDVLPLVFGGGHEFTYGQYMAYEPLDKLVSLLNVDASIDIDGQGGEAGPDNHLHRILMHEPNYLFNLSHLAYQSYLVDTDTLRTFEKLYFDAYRLGALRPSLAEMEPVVRDADLMSFDICAIRSSDAPGSARAQPFGLSGEEACQICWYAGLNEKMSSAGIYGYDPDFDDASGKTAAVAATMIWYFIEGYYHRKGESNFRGNDYLRYVVSMPAEPAQMVFYKSKLSEKWWMEVPYPHGVFMYERNLIVPCSYSDYQAAARGEVPERWIYHQAKLL